MASYARAAIRRFIERRLLRPLVFFLLASFGIAFVQWSLSPEIAPHWLRPLRISDSAAFTILFALSFLWLGVVTAGLIKCGWPGLLMLIPAKYGLLPFYLIGSIYWACAVRGGCL